MHHSSSIHINHQMSVVGSPTKVKWQNTTNDNHNELKLKISGTRNSTLAQSGRSILGSYRLGNGSATGSFNKCPSDYEIEEFQKQLNSDFILKLRNHIQEKYGSLMCEISLHSFRACLSEVFHECPPAHGLVDHMFKRFKKVTADDEDKVLCVEIILAFILLARLIHDKKIQIIFETFDDDRDGYMSPQEITNMHILLEKVFAREQATANVNNITLQNFNAEKRGQQNALFIISLILHQKKPKYVHTQDDQIVVMNHAQKNEQISYQNYIRALRQLDDLKKRILPPPTITFKQVLSFINKNEDQNTKTTAKKDELHSRFKLNQYHNRVPEMKLAVALRGSVSLMKDQVNQLERRKSILLQSPKIENKAKQIDRELTNSTQISKKALEREQLLQGRVDNMFKVKLDGIDPSKIDLQQFLLDNDPAQTKQLEKLNRCIKDYDKLAENQVDKTQKKYIELAKRYKNLIPERSKDVKNSSKMMFDLFHLQNDKYGSQNKKKDYMC